MVPRALLEFSRYIMRERFSALIRKPVYTFKFDRFRTVTPETYRKLVKARNSKSIVVTTPVDIKAFFLKYIEILHMLDAATSKGTPFSLNRSALLLNLSALLTKPLFSAN